VVVKAFPRAGYGDGRFDNTRASGANLTSAHRRSRTAWDMTSSFSGS
jgi:hypothetical protein